MFRRSLQWGHDHLIVEIQSGAFDSQPGVSELQWGHDHLIVEIGFAAVTSGNTSSSFNGATTI